MEAMPDFESRLMLNIARFHIQLEALSFDSVGGLHFDDTGGTRVGSLMTTLQTSSQAPFHLGPFTNAKDRYVAWFDNIIRHISEDAWCPPSQARKRLLVALESRDLVSECEEMEQGPWYLKHGEVKGDHFLFDEQGDIAGVIDWEL